MWTFLCLLSCFLFPLGLPSHLSLDPRLPVVGNTHCRQLSRKGEDLSVPLTGEGVMIYGTVSQTLCAYESPTGLGKKQILLQEVEGGA